MSPSPPSDSQRAGPCGLAAGAGPRERLLQAGLRLFALQGYAKTSTRELAETAQVNVAAISYYFGDKAGLYRAVFQEPMGGHHEPGDTAFAQPGLPLAEALRGFYAGFLEPLKHGDGLRLCMKLHFREFLEPTGLWDDYLAHGIRPVHEALLSVVCRHLGLARPDEEAQRLVVGLAGLGVHLHVGYDINETLAPGLMQVPDATERWAEGLVQWGLAMVQSELQRRAATGGSGPRGRSAMRRPAKQPLNPTS